MIVKPVEGRLVRDPATMRVVPAEGLSATNGDLYWQRASLEGDVTLEADPAPATEPATEAAAASADATPEAAAEPASTEESHS